MYESWYLFSIIYLQVRSLMVYLWNILAREKKFDKYIYINESSRADFIKKIYIFENWWECAPRLIVTRGQLAKPFKEWSWCRGWQIIKDTSKSQSLDKNDPIEPIKRRSTCSDPIPGVRGKICVIKKSGALENEVKKGGALGNEGIEVIN